MRNRTALLALSLSVLAFTPARAQAPYAPPQSRVEMVFKLGGVFPQGHSDLWSFNESLFTADAQDFDDSAFAMDFLVLLNNHADLVFGFETYEGAAGSVYRDYVDSFGQPIGQHQTLDLVPFTASLRWLPFGRFDANTGRPRAVVPYLSAGLGWMFWHYDLSGSFVDLGTLEIFDDHFHSDGTTVLGTAAAGIEVPVSRAWSIQLEGRYQWARDDLDEDFLGFGEFDLSSWGAFFGAGVRF
jgi:hypothetical protein